MDVSGGKAISNEKDGLLIAGAAGVACCLGGDFEKINVPHATQQNNQILQIASQTAGSTRLVCSGGKQKEPGLF